MFKEIIRNFESEVGAKSFLPSDPNYDEARNMEYKCLNGLRSHRLNVEKPMTFQSKTRVFQASASYASKGAYVNFVTKEETDQEPRLRRQLSSPSTNQKTV